MPGRCTEELQKYWDSLEGGPHGLIDTVVTGPVAIVAVKGGAGYDWAAYAAPIEWDENHRMESGGKLREKEARAFFDQALFDCGSYRR
jgi:hypothetical protein